MDSDDTLLLELLNSRPIVDGVEQDELAEQRPAGEWVRARGQRFTRAGWEQLLLARDALRDVVQGASTPAALAPFLTDVSSRPVADAAGLRWELALPKSDELAARAVLAWGELERSSPGRLRACGNPECQLFLIDRSKANSARWCSMATCGNRMKARRHYERARQSD